MDNEEGDWERVKRARQEERDHTEPKRVEYAADQLLKIGYATQFDGTNRCLLFKFRGAICRIYPFTGWWSGKGIGSGRGVHKLIKKLMEQK